MNDYCIVLTTFSDKDNGQKIINSLLDKKLAACVQVQKIESFYHWEGKVNCDDEFLAIIKTKQICYQDIEAEILTLHEYDTPQVTMVPIKDGASDYLGWIDSVCR